MRHEGHPYHLIRMPDSFTNRYAKLLCDKNANAVDRCDAALNLGKRGGREAFPALAAAALDEDFWVRLDVAKAMALIADPRCLSFLLEMMGDPDEVVRYESCRALEQVFANLSTHKVYDLLTQFEENSARGSAAFHVTAVRKDVALNVFNRRIVAGRGFDVVMTVGDRTFKLHEGTWRFLPADKVGISFISEDSESGIEIQVRIECGAEEFRILIDAVFPRDTIVRHPRCELFLASGPQGLFLPATNGLEHGPIRKFQLGNDILISLYEGHEEPYGVVLDTTESPAFRQIRIGEEADGRPVYLSPRENEQVFSAGPHRLMDCRLRPLVDEEHFREVRESLLSRYAIGSDSLRGDCVGSVFRLTVRGKNLLSSNGLFVNYVDEKENHLSFDQPFRFKRKDTHSLEAVFRHEAAGVCLKLEISLSDQARFNIRVTESEFAEKGGELRIGLLFSRTFGWWRTEEDWKPFKPQAPDQGKWEITLKEAVAAAKAVYLKPVNDPEMPEIEIDFQTPESVKAEYALLTTDENFAARSLELRLPADPRSLHSNCGIVVRAVEK